MQVDTATTIESASLPPKKAFYTSLSFQVLAGVAVAVVIYARVPKVRNYIRKVLFGLKVRT